jgi:hypothetical protein
LDAAGWSHYLRSQPWQDGVKFNHSKSDVDISHKLHLLERINFRKLKDSEEKAITIEEWQNWFLTQWYFELCYKDKHVSNWTLLNPTNIADKKRRTTKAVLQSVLGTFLPSNWTLEIY